MRGRADIFVPLAAAMKLLKPVEARRSGACLGAGFHLVVGPTIAGFKVRWLLARPLMLLGSGGLTAGLFGQQQIRGGRPVRIKLARPGPMHIQPVRVPGSSCLSKVIWFYRLRFPSPRLWVPSSMLRVLLHLFSANSVFDNPLSAGSFASGLFPWNSCFALPWWARRGRPLLAVIRGP